ncbi:MAG TPA: hypothetical protein VMK82_06590, partial [Steroidobacteraceae bacterium]|nr:hypothetical protein [Steroidobacteraceae bacterium]
MSFASQPLPMPLCSEHVALLGKLVEDGNRDTLLWASGYLAGAAGALAAPAAAPLASALQASALRPVVVLYGSQTGNAKRAGEALH